MFVWEIQQKISPIASWKHYLFRFSGLLNTGMATTHLWAIGPGGRECIMFIHTYYQYIGVGLLCPIKQELMFFCFPLPSLIYQKLR